MPTSDPHAGLDALIATAMARESPGAERDLTSSDTKILDATMEVVGTHGEENLTIDLVAKRARLSRMTVFRRFGSKQNLITSAYRREVSAVLRDVGERALSATTVLECATTVTANLVAHATNIAAVQRMVHVEPENVVRLWRSGDWPGQPLGRIFLSHLLQDKRLDDPLPPEQADLVADVLVRIVLSLVLVPDTEYVMSTVGGTEPYLYDVIRRLIQHDNPSSR